MHDSHQSSDSNPTPNVSSVGSATRPFIVTFREQLWPAIASLFVFTLVAGGIFPLALFVLAKPLFPSQIGGSLLTREGVIIGSELIGQNFTGPGYFHPRPSAAGAGYDAASSGGTNLGPANPKLRDGTPDDPTTPAVDESFVGVRQLAEEYRKRNGLPPDLAVPIDAVTHSGSGLDPHISPANALLQMERVSRARGLRTDLVCSLVAKHTQGRQLGFLGEPRVAVLPLNIDLDRTASPPNPASPKPLSSESR